ARLVSFNARDRANPSFDEVVGALLDVTWGAPTAGDAHDSALRRVAQRATVDALLDLAGNAAATSEVRATAEHHLARLRELASRGGAGGAEQGHRAAVRRDIERYFEGRDDRAARPRPAPVPLPWP
ncbi:MAG TPA: hypothetical protein VFZ56_12825, partial [Gemmatimonadaceae bacterium]